MTKMKDRLHTGELYLPGDDEIMTEQTKCLERLYDFNMTRPSEGDRRFAMLKEMLAEVGEGCYVEPPFHANFGGAHVHFGKGVYANFNFTVVDDTHIYVGDHTMFGPNVTLATAGHPILPELREQGYQYNMPIHIGKKLLAGRGRHRIARYHHRRQQRHRSGERRHQGYPRKRRGGRQPVSRFTRNKRARQAVLFRR